MQISQAADAAVRAVPATTTGSADTATQRCKDAEAFLNAQDQRRNDAHARSALSKFKSKCRSAVTFKTTDEPPAVQLPGGEWTEPAVSEIISTYLWELDKHKIQNIDVVELAHVVYCLERWRSERRSCTLLNRESDPAWQWCDKAIEAWLKAFHLDQMLSLEALEQSFGAGGTAYQHKGKSILAGYCATLAPYLIKLLPGAEVAAGVARGGCLLVQAYFDLMAGDERILRRPHDDLASVLSLKASAKAASAPSMQEAQRLAGNFHQAEKLTEELRAALVKGTPVEIKAALTAADALLDEEARVKSVLYPSAAEWAGKQREIPARIAAGGTLAAAAITSLACPPAALIAIPAGLAASAAIHPIFHFSDATRRDARDRSTITFLNRLKCYDWVDEGKMGRTIIADLYRQYVAKEISRETLRIALEQAKAFKLDMAGDAMQFPIEQRLGIAGTLLRGQLAELLDKQLVRSRRPEPAHGALPIARRMRVPFTRGERSNPDMTLSIQRDRIADIVNLSKAIQLMAKENDPDSAQRFLHAIKDEAVHKLFTGTIYEQTMEAARAKKLTKGELDKFRLMLAAGAASGVVIGPAYSFAAGVEQLVSQNPETLVTYHVPANLGIAVAAAATQALAPESSTPIHSFKKRESALNLDKDDKQAVMEVVIKVPSLDTPLTPDGIPIEQANALLAEDRLPAKILVVDDQGRSISIDLADTEPYYNELRRKHTVADCVKKLRAVGNISLEVLGSPFARLMTMRCAKKSRDARRELRRVVDAAHNSA